MKANPLDDLGLGRTNVTVGADQLAQLMGLEDGEVVNAWADADGRVLHLELVGPVAEGRPYQRVARGGRPDSRPFMHMLKLLAATS